MWRSHWKHEKYDDDGIVFRVAQRERISFFACSKKWEQRHCFRMGKSGLMVYFFCESGSRSNVCFRSRGTLINTTYCLRTFLCLI